MPKQGGFGFGILIKDFENIKITLPKEIGQEAVTHFQENFPQQGFDGKKWKPRVHDKTPGRAILTKSGILRRSIRVASASFDKTVVATDVPYAKIHNEGGTINHPARTQTISFSRKKGKLKMAKNGKGTVAQSKVSISAYQIRMPKRQFMGDSKKLDQKIMRIIDKRVTFIFK